MKTRHTCLIFFFLCLTGMLCAQDTIFVMKQGKVQYFRALSDIDSISFVNTLDVRRSIVEKVALEPRFSLFYEALSATGMVDSLQMDQDRTYNPALYTYLISYPKSNPCDYWYQAVPSSRYFRYTVFMESNETYGKLGIFNLEKLKEYAKSVYDEVFPEDAGITDVTDRKNSLNRFISYHLITKKLTTNLLIDAYDTDHMIKTQDMYEYLETMCPNTLMEISKIRSTNKTNQINRSALTGNAVQIVASSENDPKSNGIYHEIDNVLVYSSTFSTALSNKRLRFDFSSFFDELTNNSMRGIGPQTLEPRFIIPNGYLKRLSCSDQATIQYLTPFGKYLDYQGDELSVRANYGKLFDISLETLPIPAGNYEVRLGYIATGSNAIVQFYMDGIPMNGPVNLMISGSAPSIGNVIPHTILNDPDGFENDKTLRNHSYMKGPACFKVPVGGFFPMSENARFELTSLRRIIGTLNFQNAAKHVLSVKSLGGAGFQLDYIEFVPTSLLETEDIY